MARARRAGSLRERHATLLVAVLCGISALFHGGASLGGFTAPRRSIAVVTMARASPSAARVPEPGSVDPGAELESTRLPGVRRDLASRIGQVPTGLVDENEALEKSAFPIPAEDLIALTKAHLADQDLANGTNADWFADDFRFVAPVVGPFGKDEYIKALSTFELRKAFPDISSNYHHFRVDPFEPNRVWFSIKFTATNTGPILGQPATGKTVESPVQAHSYTFNERGEITKQTIGYVLDKETGNTGGLGGAFGLFYAIGYGLPFPEAQPWTPSPLYGALMGINKFVSGVLKPTQK